jgi:hypothetical protein
MPTAENPPLPQPSRREKLPPERPSLTRRLHIKYQEPDPKNEGKFLTKHLRMYVTAGMYEDGRIGELFIRGEKQGELLSGVLDQFATSISLGLQHGVPLQAFTIKMRGTQFGPAQQFGLDDQTFTGCTSPFDLLAKWLDSVFPDGKFKNPHTKDTPHADVPKESQA